LRVMNDFLMLMVKPPPNYSVMKEQEQNQQIVQFMREMASIREQLLCSDSQATTRGIDEEIAALESRALQFLSNTLGIMVQVESCTDGCLNTSPSVNP
jgi:hypothetical protein